MKVSKLIEFLQSYNPDADITLTTSEDIMLSYVSKDVNNNVLTKDTTTQVFIEGIDACVECVHQYTEAMKTMCSAYDKPCKMVKECYQFEEPDDCI